ncbi:hypothetical protein STA1M1_01840 [Sinisalibacter aestuarii]|uniref:Uncharacterized protein n=2 Tax=Sinisalibacter aestuarii TaxID=2949426 RepID=A0ABQ5LMR8_9RHOB|nr:hypothetical protein STA1M1_01840 [Sinisalibacter aestuarii]
MIATLTAALALSPLAASPARAGNEETIGAIAAASVFALITAGIVANAATQKGHKSTPTPHHYTPRRDPEPNRWDHGRTRTDPRKLLPAQCEFSVNHGRDRGSYYSSQCLQRSFNHWPYLPDRCEKRIDGPGRHDIRAYDASCLARYGYREDERSRGRDARR